MDTENKNRKIALYTFLELIALLALTMYKGLWILKIKIEK